MKISPKQSSISNGLIFFNSSSNSSYDRKRLKCNECQVQFNEDQPRYQHINSLNPCSHVICLWCCFEKTLQYFTFPYKCFLKCCTKPFQGLYKSLENTLKSICIICGKHCQFEKLEESGAQKVKFLVGKKCYQQLVQRGISHFKTQSKLDKKLYKQIKNYSQSSRICQIKQCLQRYVVDLLIATEEQKQVECCQKCYKKSFKALQKIEKIVKQINKCHKCLQPQIYREIGIFFGLSQNKHQFQLVQIPANWEKSNDKLWYCSFCLYQDYLNMQLQKSKYQWLRYTFIRRKAKYQRHFINNCMVCSIKAEKSDYVFTICSQNTMSIFSYICENCHNLMNREPNKYKCLEGLKKFLIDTGQNNMTTKNTVEKKKFDISAQSMLDYLLKEKQKLKKSNTLSNIFVNNTGQSYDIDQSKQIKYWEQGDDEFHNCRSDDTNPLNSNFTNQDNAQNRFSRNLSFLQSQQILGSANGIVIPQIPGINDQNQEDKMKEFNYNENDSIITVEKKYTQLSSDDYGVLEQFKFEPLEKERDQLREFDEKKLQKSVIEEFKKIFETPLVPQPMHSGSLIQPDKNAWGMVKLTDDPKNVQKKKSCHFYQQCHTQQDYLNIGLLCNLCFAKYLIGDTYIAEKLQKAQNPSEQKNQIVQKPKIEESAKKNQKKNNSLFRGIF